MRFYAAVISFFFFFAFRFLGKKICAPQLFGAELRHWYDIDAIYESSIKW